MAGLPPYGVNRPRPSASPLHSLRSFRRVGGPCGRRMESVTRPFAALRRNRAREETRRSLSLTSVLFSSLAVSPLVSSVLFSLRSSLTSSTRVSRLGSSVPRFVRHSGARPSASLTRHEGRVTRVPRPLVPARVYGRRFLVVGALSHSVREPRSRFPPSPLPSVAGIGGPPAVYEESVGPFGRKITAGTGPREAALIHSPYRRLRLGVSLTHFASRSPFLHSLRRVTHSDRREG